VKLPEDVIISREKLLRYLLLPREVNDKSQFLSQAGYSYVNWNQLRSDLYELITKNEIENTTSSPYGTKYTVRGILTGPNGRQLHVVTVWITLKATNKTRFVTLFPGK